MDKSNVELLKLDLGGNRFVVVSEYDQSIYVHIREFGKTPDGRSYPTLKGLALNASKFALLKMVAEEIDENVNRLNSQTTFHFTSHLGGGIYVTVQTGFFFVDFRKHFLPEGQELHMPTKKGLSLRIKEWKILKSKLSEISKASPELENAVPCCFSSLHSNQEANALCNECKPFGLNN